MSWAGHVLRSAYIILIGKPNGTRPQIKNTFFAN